MREVDLAYRTLFAELCERVLDASFESEFDLDGRFVPVEVKGKRYWYFDKTENGANRRRYVGPVLDQEITRRVESFRTLKTDHRSRRKLVTSLVRDAGFARPDPMTGDVVAALAEAGFFRLRGVLVGTVAFQCLGGVLGIRLPSAALQTGDVDVAQFHSVSAAVGDTLPPVLDVLGSVDPSFRAVPHVSDGPGSVQFRADTGFRIDFLTPNTGRADHANGPARMPALGGAAAQPIRFLDFLIHEPIRSVMLHKSGIAVNVPAPERFAVHKLMVAAQRRRDAAGNAKAAKDLQQAGVLATALAVTRRQGDLAMAWTEAWERGPAWRKSLETGWTSLKPDHRGAVREALLAGLAEIDVDPEGFGLG